MPSAAWGWGWRSTPGASSAESGSAGAPAERLAWSARLPHGPVAGRKRLERPHRSGHPAIAAGGVQIQVHQAARSRPDLAQRFVRLGHHHGGQSGPARQFDKFGPPWLGREQADPMAPVFVLHLRSPSAVAVPSATSPWAVGCTKGTQNSDDPARLWISELSDLKRFLSIGPKRTDRRRDARGGLALRHRARLDNPWQSAAPAPPPRACRPFSPSHRPGRAPPDGLRPGPGDVRSPAGQGRHSRPAAPRRGGPGWRGRRGYRR